MFQEDLSYGLFLSDRQLDFLYNYPQGFDRMKCFATFLQMAVKEPTHYEKKGYSVGLTPGLFAISEVELAQLWKCNRKTASKMVDMFHEVGLVSSVPNCRTTVFTVHCIASWYVGGQVIRNAHYSRNPRIEPRIKVNHKSQNAATCNVGNGTATNGIAINSVVANRADVDGVVGKDTNDSNFFSLSSTESDLEQTVSQSDGQAIEQRDGYTSNLSAPVSRDYSQESNGREKELFNAGDASTMIEEYSPSASVGTTDAANINDSPENEAQPFPKTFDYTNSDATAIDDAGTTTDDAE